jgi:CRISPR system Cascade subunit CasA
VLTWPSRFSLIDTPWLPVIRASGRRQLIRPADLTDGIDADPIVDIDWPRPDFRCATLEFLIGLLTVACPPHDWGAWWDKPPTIADLEAAFAPLASAFELDGGGPRAYQDFEELQTEPTTVEALLIEAPGAQTVRNNAALLVKSGRVEVLSRSAAAAALLTLQTMAPAGGAGHRTSLRGGGPLTTLVLPGARPTLWHRLWTNVPPASEPSSAADLPRIFPWLASTRVSDKNGRTTTPVDVDQRQAFFGMPRRIRLDFEPNVERIACDLTGVVDDVIVRSYRTRPHGTNYDAWGGKHPLTPHYRAKPNDPVLSPVHGQEGRIGYRQWVAMLYGDADAKRVPAACVSLFVRQRKDDLPRGEWSFRLMAAGYAMDNMKALSFVEAETPDITVPDAPDDVAQKAKDFVAAADVTARALVQAVRLALYGDGAEIGSDTTPLTTARERFWAETNDAFFERLNAFSQQPAEQLSGDAAIPLSRAWLNILRDAALAIFDDMTPVQDTRAPDVKRVIGARRLLVSLLLGYAKRSTELFKHLQLPLPETRAKRGKAA